MTESKGTHDMKVGAVSAERLEDLIRAHRDRGHSGTYPGSGGMHPDWSDMTADALAELAALRAAKPADDQADDSDRMQKISKVISDLQSIQERFGDTCVYIRRGGMSWGAVALNRRDDDKENGVFDLQAQHDRDMAARLQQVQRLIDANRELRALPAAPRRSPGDLP